MNIGLALFVYKRPDLTSKVLEGIRINGFDKIYIFQDGIKKETDREDWIRVNSMINNIDYIEKEVHVSENNKGLAESIIDGMNYVFTYHDCAIALEDDIVLAKGYKAFAEKCFELYEKDDLVTSIAGTGNGTLIPPDYPWDLYFCHRMSSAGFGTWKKYWNKFKRDPFVLKRILKDEEKRKFLMHAGNDLELMLYDSVAGKNDTWATYWALYQVEMLSYQAIPVKGLALDIGREGGGTNSKEKSHRYIDDFYDGEVLGYRYPPSIIRDNRIEDDTVSIMDVSTDGERYKFYNELYNKWIKIKNERRSLSQYFVNHNIDTIYIFGAASAADLLLLEIKNKINVKGIIVENRKETRFHEFDVKEIENVQMEERIPVVITPGHALKYIKHLWKKLGITNPIISIMYIVDEVYKDAIE